MAFKKLSNTPNDTGLALDVERNALARWNGQEFVLIVDPADIDAAKEDIGDLQDEIAVKELPTVPEEDGLYLLVATVTDGTAVLSWELKPAEEAGGGA